MTTIFPQFIWLFRFYSPSFLTISLCILLNDCLYHPALCQCGNQSVFLRVWCRWNNMTRAKEPIHSQLVIRRHFDLPQRSSISIRCVLGGDKPAEVFAPSCLCCYACVSVFLCVLGTWEHVVRMSLTDSNLSHMLPVPVKANTFVTLKLWRTLPLHHRKLQLQFTEERKCQKDQITMFDFIITHGIHGMDKLMDGSLKVMFFVFFPSDLKKSKLAN